jgi:hypothetical protein
MTELDKPLSPVEIPYSTLVLVFGIASIPCCCIVAGVFSIVFGILAIVYHKRGMALYLENPEKYTKSSHSNLVAGNVCGIIGLVFGSLVFLVALAYIAIWGVAMGHIFQILEL